MQSRTIETTSEVEGKQEEIQNFNLSGLQFPPYTSILGLSSESQTYLAGLPVFPKLPYYDYQYFYRGDDIKFNEAFEKGFTSRGNNMDLITHFVAKGGQYSPTSGYISTSLSKDVASTFPRELEFKNIDYSYLYEINSHKNAIYLPEALRPAVATGNLNPLHYLHCLLEKEMSVPLHINPRDIKGAWPIPNIMQSGLFNSKYPIREAYIQNPNYVLPPESYAKQIWKAGKLVSHGLAAVGIALDALSLYSEYETSQETGDYNNAYREAARIAGAWSGATATGYIFAEIAVGGCMPAGVFNPYIPPFCGLAGGLYGAYIGYQNGGELAINVFNSSLTDESITAVTDDGNLDNTIENAKQINYDERDRELIEAAKIGDISKAFILLEMGANPNAVDVSYYNYTPLHWAAAYGHKSLVELLLESEANLNSQALSGHGTSLNVSRANPNNQLMQNFLINYQNKIDRELIEAAKIGDVSKVVTLVKKGANPNATDGCYFHYTPLMWASGHNFPKIVAPLLNNGANPNARSANGYSALDIAYTHPGTTEIRAMLSAAGGKAIQTEYEQEVARQAQQKEEAKIRQRQLQLEGIRRSMAQNAVDFNRRISEQNADFNKRTNYNKQIASQNQSILNISVFQQQRETDLVETRIRQEDNKRRIERMRSTARILGHSSIVSSSSSSGFFSSSVRASPSNSNSNFSQACAQTWSDVQNGMPICVSKGSD